ncbi:hypothetical protein NG798_26050 [Ancylothrix sp. C2]|nr:hypothetical protein [Ancylothrix sp. D3o]
MPTSVEGLLVEVVPVAVMLGDSTVEVDSTGVAVMLWDSTGVADMDMEVADIAVPVVMGKLDMDGAVVVVVPVDMNMAGPMDMAVSVDMAVPVDIVMPMVVVDMAEVPVVPVVDIDNLLFCGGFGMLASMLILGV